VRINVAFWGRRQPSVLRTLCTRAAVLIDAVSLVRMHDVSAADAKRAGFDSMSALCGASGSRDVPVEFPTGLEGAIEVRSIASTLSSSATAPQ
jgi:hypothetical protein